jgi:NDP-sugar pyrophosphorylase family protein
MAVTDIKEKANEVRQERTSSLKGFFDNCFLPSKPAEDETDSTIGNKMYSENDTHSGSSTYIENDTYNENAMYIENDIHSVNTTYIENNMDIGNAIHSENTTRENDTRSESNTLINAIHSENTTRENDTYSENDIHPGNTVKLAKILGFTALGVLAVLIDEFPNGSGMLNVTKLSKSCGVARTTLITQIRALEKCGAVSLGAAEKQGRWLEILCSENATCSGNTIHPPCSSSSSSSNYLNNKNYYYREEINHIGNATCSKNDIHSDYDTCRENATYEKETHSENNIYSVNTTRLENATCSVNDTHIGNATYRENAIVTEKLSKSKITIKIAARELYFVAKASSINVDRLSSQCFQQFLSIKQSKGSCYAMALFLSLLSKSRENPTAYVIRAIQQGASPSPEDQRRAESISKAGETVFKKVGEEILQRDLDAALSRISLSGISQNQIQDELEVFTKRISE